MEIKFKKVMEALKVVLIIILGLIISLGMTILAMADENGQEYMFYDAAKQNATEYVEMGIITPEPIGNIANTEKQENNKTEYSFTIPESIYRVKIRNATVGKEKIRIETLKGVSKLTSSAPIGDIYINENIWTEPDTEIYVDFKIKNSWLDKTEDVQLLKWTGDRWKKLGLRKIGRDDTYTYFEEGLAGSSVLSIVGKNKTVLKSDENKESPLRIDILIMIFLGSVLVLYIFKQEIKKG